jgi:aminopeptidase N
MAQFLRYVFERHAFAPFTTLEFAGFFRDFAGIDLQPQFEGWLYHALER